ncbi:MAG: class I SAM-dependent methyltransferase [Burkholderiales bacterium]|nr:class I SAM-dependent methyltransferase [Burkholderiales bacterium]
MEFSDKGKELLELYEAMARHGYERTDHARVEIAFSDFELRPYRESLRTCFRDYAVSSVLDYGCGGSDWKAKGFDEETRQSAVDYFGLDQAYRYEPARSIDERQPVDCVVSFDVLEHVFVSDVPHVIRDMLSYARKLLVLNVACYPAAAKLPNGENAHVTVRPPLWWKGMLDCIASEYPGVAILLICSTAWRTSSAFPIWSAAMWQLSDTFVVDL